MMTITPLTRVPVMSTGMLIRTPAPTVFEAFIDPAITTKFWFTKSTGRLEIGKSVTWSWEMYGVSANVTPSVIDRDTRM